MNFRPKGAECELNLLYLNDPSFSSSKTLLSYSFYRVGLTLDKAKVEAATKQIKNNVKDAKPDTYVTPEQASKAPANKPADSNTVKELWNKAVKVIQEDVVKPVETTVKKVIGLETNGKPKTEDIKLKLGNTSTVKNLTFRTLLSKSPESVL